MCLRRDVYGESARPVGAFRSLYTRTNSVAPGMQTPSGFRLHGERAGKATGIRPYRYLRERQMMRWRRGIRLSRLCYLVHPHMCHRGRPAAWMDFNGPATTTSPPSGRQEKERFRQLSPRRERIRVSEWIQVHFTPLAACVNRRLIFSFKRIWPSRLSSSPGSRPRKRPDAPS
jgi:hypothetical protein